MANTKWVLDADHSEVYFKVKHLMLTTVTGYFKSFQVEAFTRDDDFNTLSELVFTADVNSIDTNSAQRDAHLRSADFFNTAENRHIKFSDAQLKGIEKEGLLSGNLTMHGITQPVHAAVVFRGITRDGYDRIKAGFSLSGKLSRKEFGLTWASITETGNVVVSDDVKFFAEIQLVKQ